MAELHAVLKTSATALSAFFWENSGPQRIQWSWLEILGMVEYTHPYSSPAEIHGLLIFVLKKKDKFNIFMFPLIIFSFSVFTKATAIIHTRKNFMFSLWNKTITSVIEERNLEKKSARYTQFFLFPLDLMTKHTLNYCLYKTYKS